MATIDPDAIFKKLGENRARMEKLGITESEMAKFYVACGAEGDGWDKAFATLKRQFKLSPEDSVFVEKVLGDCGPL